MAAITSVIDSESVRVAGDPSESFGDFGEKYFGIDSKFTWLSSEDWHPSLDNALAG
ncbi:hypothetical protein [Symbiopectobacterium sp. RP]|uniref:hypothetical protein n=1 Tax=Symbiopectobacterium sp. RP TaxID=3248553 RepID=UPI003D2A6841